jgi:phage repressor protein C with HTH and peptisase S24 domain
MFHGQHCNHSYGANANHSCGHIGNNGYMNTPGQRIKEERDKQVWSQQKLADEITRIKGESITRAAVAKWEAGSSKTQKPENFFAAAKALGLSPQWVLNEKGEKYTNHQSELLPQPTEDEFSLVQQLDLSASCGHGRFTEHVVVKGGLAFKRSSLRDIGVQEEHARVIYATGDSMEPSIGHGRVVLIDTADKKASDNKIFLICDPDGSILLKRLVREFHPGSGDMRWIMRSDNPNKTQYPDKLLPDDERTNIVGRAIWTDKML